MKNFDNAITKILNESKTDLSLLYDYLIMSDKDKILDLPNVYPNFKSDYNQDLEAYDKNQSYGEWLLYKLKTGELELDTSDYPTYTFFDYPKLISDDWLVHCTKIDPLNIVKKGFKGISDITKLGLTTHLDSRQKIVGGYNFAFNIKDFLNMIVTKKHNPLRYGDNILIFKAPSIHVYSKHDDENQNIFLGKDAYDFITIYKSGYYLKLHSFIKMYNRI